MVASFGHVSFGSLLVCCWVFTVACGDAKTQTSSASHSIASLPDGLDSSLVATLTERVESENFVFHFQPGDTVWVDRQEALHRWAIEYLDIHLPKKIDYYKFSFTDMQPAVGTRGATGRGFPQHFALASVYNWHPHETMHIYTFGICQSLTIRLYDEGMAVAHEFDPLENDWVPRWSHWPGRGEYVYAEKIREHRAAGKLHPIEELLDSRSFLKARHDERGTVNNRVVYDQAGMFVSYLIDTFGIDRMKQAICSVSDDDPRDTILQEFEKVFGVSVREAERAWWVHLDSSM